MSGCKTYTEFSVLLVPWPTRIFVSFPLCFAHLCFFRRLEGVIKCWQIHISREGMNWSIFGFLLVRKKTRDVLRLFLIALQPSFPDQYGSYVSVGGLERFCAPGNTSDLYTVTSFHRTASDASCTFRSEGREFLIVVLGLGLLHVEKSVSCPFL